MSMFIEVRINRDVIGTVEIHNVTANGPDPDLPVHTYDWIYSGNAGQELDGRVDHRYRDGAIVLAHKVIGEIAQRYQVVAHLEHDGADVSGCPLCLANPEVRPCG